MAGRSARFPSARIRAADDLTQRQHGDAANPQSAARVASTRGGRLSDDPRPPRHPQAGALDPAPAACDNGRHGIRRFSKPSASSTSTSTAPSRCARARCRSRRSPSSPRPTPCRRSPSPTPTTCSAPWSSRRSSPRAASSRSSARRSRSISATRPPSSSRLAELRVARAPIVLLAQSEAGYRNLMRLVSSLWLDPKEGDEAHLPFEALAGADGLIALTGGPAGPIDRPLGASHGRPRRGAPRAPAGNLRRPPLCRAAAPRPRVRDRDRAGADRPRRPARPAAGRDQRALFRAPARLRGARRAALHRRGRAALDRRAAAPLARSTGSRPAPRWSRCSPTCPRRPRPASRSPCAAPTGR